MLGPRVSETSHKPFKRRISVLHSPLCPLDIRSVGFLSQIFWGLVSDASPKGWGSCCQVQPPCSSGRNSRLVGTPSIVEHHTWVGFFMRPCPCLSYPSWWSSFIPCCWGAVQLVFTSFSKRIFSYVAVELVCPWEMSSGSSYLTILDFCHHVILKDVEFGQHSCMVLVRFKWNNDTKWVFQHCGVMEDIELWNWNCQGLNLKSTTP